MLLTNLLECQESCVVVAPLSRRCRRLCRTGVNHEGEDPLFNCTKALNELTGRINGHVKTSEFGKGSRFSTGGFKWVMFAKKEVKELLDIFEQNKVSLSVALNAIQTLSTISVLGAIKNHRSRRRSM